MAFSRAAPSRRNIVALLISIALLAAIFLSVWPSNYVRIRRVAEQKTRSAAAPVATLTANPNTQLRSCVTDYRLRGLDNDAKHGKRTGYVLCLTYREQQTKAAVNMFSLQCWAKTLLVNVVEPFLHDSRFVVPLDTSQKAMLAFSDVFSLRQWDALTTKLSFAPLAPWRQFLSNASRDMIVVHLQYSSVMSIHQRIESGEKATHLAISDKYKKGCTKKKEISGQLNYLAQYGFKVVREVCINFQHGDEITMLQFNSHIFGSYHPRDVTILMNEWRGFATSADSGKRILINDACWSRSTSLPSLYLRPSQRVYCDAHNYQAMYLGGRNSPYISVIVRTEKIRLIKLGMHGCLQETLKLLAHVQSTMRINSTFLSMDIGQYGSNTMDSNRLQLDQGNFSAEYDALISGIYGRGASTEMWEKTFEAVTSVREAGYIASLQKILVAEGHCLVVVGGGSFQKHTIMLHRLAKKKKGVKPCVHILKSCSRNMEIDLNTP